MILATYYAWQIVVNKYNYVNFHYSNTWLHQIGVSMMWLPPVIVVISYVGHYLAKFVVFTEDFVFCLFWFVLGWFMICVDKWM